MPRRAKVGRAYVEKEEDDWEDDQAKVTEEEEEGEEGLVNEKSGEQPLEEELSGRGRSAPVRGGGKRAARAKRGR